MSLIDLTLEVHTHLDASGLSHAFGGALALAYLVDPRGTVDIDVNVFAPTDEVDQVLVALGELGFEPESALDQWTPAAGLRLRRAADPFAVDVFLSLDDHYAEIEQRTVAWPFGPRAEPLPFLSAEDLVLFKLSFGRDKDWVDLRAIGRTVDLDLDYVERQLLALRGPQMHPRIARMRALTRSTEEA